MGNNTMVFLMLALISLWSLNVHGAALKSSSCQDAGECTRGEYFDTLTATCISCPVGTFSNMDSHNCTVCKSCSESNKPLVVIKHHCNRTHDTVFGCSEGFYLTIDHSVEYSCFPCTVCKVGQRTKQACDGYNDSVCEDDGADSKHDSSNVKDWLIPLLAVSIPAIFLIIVFALLSLNKVSSLERKFLCHRAREDDEVSIVETYKKLQEERKEKKKSKKKKKAKDRTNVEDNAPTSS